MTIKLDGLVIIQSQSGIPLYSKLGEHIEEALFSGFVSAISSFAEEMSLGSLSSFSTDNKDIHLFSRENFTIATITENQQYAEIYSFVVAIADKFGNLYTNPEDYAHEDFEPLGKEIEKLLEHKNIPFKVKVAEFVGKEFGGNVAIDTVLHNSEEKAVKIDLMVDKGKRTDGSPRDDFVRKFFKSLSEEVYLFKVVDGVAGSAEVLEFLESMKTFGSRPNEKSDAYPFFPRKAVVIARDYSPTVFENLKLSTKKGKSYVGATHLAPTAEMKISPDSFKCYVEMWKWKEPYPERIFN